MDRSATRLLIADEDPVALSFLQDNLSADGYRVDTAATHNAAMAQLRTTVPHLILADVNGKTLALLDHVRTGEGGLCTAPADTPLIALTSNHDEVHRIRLLERGSDDIITKPISYPELRARIDAVLRRTLPRRPAAILTAGPVRIDRRQRAVTINERPVEVNGLEYELLCTLVEDPARVFTRAELMNTIWGCAGTRTRTLDSHASRLRRKLANETHRLVVNVWGVGYRFMDQVPA